MLQSIQLHPCKYILGCSVTTCDEPLCANLALKKRRDFCKLNWYHKVMCMNNKRLPFKLLSNEWDKVKCKGHPRKSWLAQVDSLK